MRSSLAILAVAALLLGACRSHGSHADREPARGGPGTGAASAESTPAATGGAGAALENVERAKADPDSTRGPLLELREHAASDRDLRIADGIVDINSQITVKLHRDRIGAAVPEEWNAQFPPDRLVRLRKLSDAVAEAERSVVLIREALTTWVGSAKDDAAVQALNDALQAAAEPFDVIVEAVEATPDLHERFNVEGMALLERNPDASQVEIDTLAIRLGAELVERERTAWSGFLETNGVFFQVGAWLLSSGGPIPIHLPGLDEYPEQEHFEVERWAIRFDESQQQEFAAIQEQAHDLNQNLVGGQSPLHAYRELIGSLAQDTARKCTTQFASALRDFADEAVPPEVAEIAATAKQLARRVEDFVQQLEELRLKYGSIQAKDPAQVLAALGGVRQDLEEASAALRGIAGSAESLNEQVETLDVTGEAKAAFDKFKSALAEAANGCLDDALANLQALSTALGLELAPFEVNEELLEFTDQVERHTLDSLPASTEFDLCTSGQRAAGDRIVLKVAVGRAAPGDDPSAKPERRVLETRRLTLYRIEPHLTTSVNLIWANPMDSSSLVRDYQAAASYSVLYKWGRRDSHAFNSLWSPGIGINLSALDFDKDDNPELGVALVVTLVRDYLQAGYGYDPAVDTDYWFFGIRLPLPTWTLPGQGADPDSP
jgi:hypothetical protein